MISPKVKKRFAGEPGVDVVAQKIDVVFADGEKRRVVLRLGIPYRKPDEDHEYCWWIRSELENLDSTDGPLAGCGPLDTLAAGMRWIDARLASYKKKLKCRYYWPDTDQIFDFRSVMKTVLARTKKGKR